MNRQQELISKYSSRSGLKGKIIAKCIECIYDGSGGGGSWRQQVEACTCTGCPLYSVRPVSKPGIKEEPVDAI